MGAYAPSFFIVKIQSPNSTFSVAVDKTYHIAYPIVDFAVWDNVRITIKRYVVLLFPAVPDADFFLDNIDTSITGNNAMLTLDSFTVAGNQYNLIFHIVWHIIVVRNFNSSISLGFYI